jgi:hypothetical protein
VVEVEVLMLLLEQVGRADQEADQDMEVHLQFQVEQETHHQLVHHKVMQVEEVDVTQLVEVEEQVLQEHQVVLLL